MGPGTKEIPPRIPGKAETAEGGTVPEHTNERRWGFLQRGGRRIHID